MGMSVEEITKWAAGNEDLLRLNPQLRDIITGIQARPRKYRNVVTNGFDSGREAARASELQLLEREGHIHCLTYQVAIEIQPDGAKKRIIYKPDFIYLDEALRVVVEDAKGVRTKDYRIKKKLFEAKYGIEVKET